jgi:hypothetical protein
MVDSEQSNWLKKLPLVEFSINSSIGASTSYAPFEINYGRVPSMGLDNLPPSAFHGVTAVTLNFIQMTIYFVQQNIYA